MHLSCGIYRCSLKCDASGKEIETAFKRRLLPLHGRDDWGQQFESCFIFNVATCVSFHHMHSHVDLIDHAGCTCSARTCLLGAPPIQKALH